AARNKPMLGRDMAPARAGRPDNTSLTAWGRRLGDARPERFDDASSAPQPRTADTSRAPLEAPVPGRTIRSEAPLTDFASRSELSSHPAKSRCAGARLVGKNFRENAFRCNADSPAFRRDETLVVACPFLV